MSIIRIRDPNALSPLHVVMICLVAATVAGSSWFLSAAESKTLVDGAVAWQVDSPLHAVVQLLCLNYRFPTTHAGDVKIYILGIGAGLAVLSLSIAIAANSRGTDDDSGKDDEPETSATPEETVGSIAGHKPHITPLLAAQLLVAMYLLWSFASSRWSAAPPLAVGGSVLLTIHFLWAFAIGNGLSPSAARVASRIIISVAAVTALIAVWYLYGRNPTLRAKFPFGNPNFLSACLVPGTLLAVTLVCEKIGGAVRTRSVLSIAAVACGLGVIGVSLWVFHLAGSRGPLMGLAIGTLAIVFFAAGRRVKLIPLVLAVAVTLFAWTHYSALIEDSSSYGRSDTVRFRMYTWGYAWQMFCEKPLTGHGQGGFVLAGDSHVGDDVLADPEALRARIAHAHNEWLEIMADLGAVGIVLLATALCLTLRAAMLTLDELVPRDQHWVLIGLMGALVGLTVEEAFGVGLRVSGVPTMFYTVIGLIWTLCGRRSALVRRLCETGGRRGAAAVVGTALGLAALVLTQQDFAAARSARRAEEQLEAGKYEEAIRLARAAQSRLNPQRALTSLHHLSEAHAFVAKTLQERAIDRESRARVGDFVDQQLLAFGQQDRRKSDQHCVEGSRVLKQLISWSPGFLNNGRVEYWLNLIQADNAAARQDHDTRQLALRNAATAIERELSRQPFNPAIALDYVGVAGQTANLSRIIDVLARPLRYHRITVPYVETLAELAKDLDFDEQIEPILQEARRTVGAWPGEKQDGPSVEIWAPEKLRLAAIIQFRRGDYRGARETLELAAQAYDALSGSAPMGAACFYKELADCRFFNTPGNPEPAIESASLAMRLAPESAQGRRLRHSVRQRLIDYYLAADREDDAKQLLKAAGHSGMTTETLSAELGTRYRGLCESLLGRRLASVLRRSPNDLLPKLKRWVDRAIVLNPDDYLAHFHAADLAFHQGDCESTAAHLKRALDRGLPLDVARRFLEVARDKKPGEAALESLWVSVTKDQ